MSGTKKLPTQADSFAFYGVQLNNGTEKYTQTEIESYEQLEGFLKEATTDNKLVRITQIGRN